MNNKMKKPLAHAIGATFLASAAVSVMAASGPFTANPLSSGYDLVSKNHTEGKCGEGKCGTGKKAEAEGKCGDMEKCKAEGKCGEGKCGDAKKCEGETPKLQAAPAKAEAEGKCGEGACGAMH